MSDGAVVDATEFVASRDRAAGIAGLSTRQVDYWSSTGVVRPTVDTRLTPSRPIRLYAFTELMSLMVAAELRNRKVSLQHIRVIVNHLRQVGYESPLTELRFATVKGQVYFQHSDGEWEGGIRPNQVVIHEVLALEPLRARVSQARQRNPGDVGRIERRRGTMGYKPVFAGTRVPVATVQRYIAAGKATEEIIESFPALEPGDVDAARQLAS